MFCSLPARPLSCIVPPSTALTLTQESGDSLCWLGWYLIEVESTGILYRVFCLFSLIVQECKSLIFTLVLRLSNSIESLEKEIF